MVGAALVAALLPTKHFFDYQSYMNIFYDQTNLLPEWEPFFVILNKMFNRLGFSYEQFRWAYYIFFVSSHCKFIEFLRSNQTTRNNCSAFLHSDRMMAILFPIYFYEFALIRMRVGLAISLYCLALINCIEFKNKGLVINICLAIVFLTLAFLSHKLGAVILLYLAAFPFFYAFLFMHKNNFIVIWKYISFIFAFIIIYVATHKEGVRGYNLASELNPFRFYSIALIPLVIYLQQKYTVKNPQKGFFDNLHQGFSLVYCYLALNLVGFYVLNQINHAGEAVVRVFTLASFLCLILSGATLRVKGASFPIYLIVVNEVFFIHTTNLVGRLF